MMTSRQVFLGRLGACLLSLLVLSPLVAAEDDGLVQDTLETLDRALGEAFARPVQGKVLYRDQQSMVLTIGINYNLPAAERGADWADKVTRMLEELGAVHVLASDHEVRAEKLPIAGKQAVATHFNATADRLEVVVIFLEL